MGGARTTWNACTLDSTVVLDAGGGDAADGAWWTIEQLTPHELSPAQLRLEPGER